MKEMNESENNLQDYNLYVRLKLCKFVILDIENMTRWHGGFFPVTPRRRQHPGWAPTVARVAKLYQNNSY